MHVWSKNERTKFIQKNVQYLTDFRVFGFF
ncbi:hypothetical protein [Salmonella phage SD-12_S18]|nr:hypothetical protein [Salmonella phage SD-12_S18]